MNRDVRLLKKYRTANSPPVEGWQAQPDGVVASPLHRQFPSCGGVAGATGWSRQRMEGWQAQPDGVVASPLRQFPSCGGVAGAA